MIKKNKSKVVLKNLESNKTKFNKKIVKILFNEKKNSHSLNLFIKKNLNDINSESRLAIWSYLLGLKKDDLKFENLSVFKIKDFISFIYLNDSEESFYDDVSLNEFKFSKNKNQIKLDVKRSFFFLRFSVLNKIYDEKYDLKFLFIVYNLRKELFILISKIFATFNFLNYYQGYHDIASIILLVCSNFNMKNIFFSNFNFDNQQKNLFNTKLSDQIVFSINKDLAFKLLKNLTLFHLRDFMLKDISLSLYHLKLIPTILEFSDSLMFQIIKQLNVYVDPTNNKYSYNFYQGISSIITFFSHNLNNANQILSIWDFILSYNSVLTTEYIYSASLIFFRRKILKELGIESEKDKNLIKKNYEKVFLLFSSKNFLNNLSNKDLKKILKISKNLIDSTDLRHQKNSNHTFNLWFKKFNKHSVLLTTSNLYCEFNTQNESKHFCLKKKIIHVNTKDYIDILKKQESEISSLIEYEILLIQSNNLLNEKKSKTSNYSCLINFFQKHNFLSKHNFDFFFIDWKYNIKKIKENIHFYRKIFENKAFLFVTFTVILIMISFKKKLIFFLLKKIKYNFSFLVFKTKFFFYKRIRLCYDNFF